jgi:microcystin-dependent protein
MADTSSPLLQLLLMGTGGDSNAWGANLNNQVFLLLEQAIADITSVSTTGGPSTVSAANARSATIIISGALVSDATITVPATRKKWTFINNCTGAFFVLLKTAGGTAINLPAGKFVDVISDGSNALYRQDAHEVGNLFYHAGTTPPAGSLECNGALPLRASTPDLFGKIGTVWGAGDGFTTYKLPNAEDTNRFLRAAGGALTVGTYQASQFTQHTHSLTGAPSVGTLGTSDPGNHTHANSLNDLGHTHSDPNSFQIAGNPTGVGGGGGFGSPFTGTTGGNNQAPMSITNAPAGAHTHTITGAPGIGTLAIGTAGAGTETRPEAMVGLLCIRY